MPKQPPKMSAVEENTAPETAPQVTAPEVVAPPAAKEPVTAKVTKTVVEDASPPAAEVAPASVPAVRQTEPFLNEATRREMARGATSIEQYQR